MRVGLYVLTLALLVAPLPQWNTDTTRITRRAMDAFAYIHLDEIEGDRTANGSGFYVDDFLVMTAAHNLMDGKGQVTVGRWPDDMGEAEVVLLDKDLDLALLRTPRKGADHLEIGRKHPEVTIRVVSVTAPLGLSGGVVFFGQVSAAWKDNRMILIDMTAMHGQSGAAVVALDGRDRGRAIGVISMAWGEPGWGTVALAVNADAIREFLDGVPDE